MKLLYGLVFMLVAFATPASAQERTQAQFCGVWENVCNRTCPTGPGTCRDVCASRLRQCHSNGCFHFNVPAPRCYSSAADRALLVPVGQRKNQNGR